MTVNTPAMENRVPGKIENLAANSGTGTEATSIILTWNGDASAVEYKVYRNNQLWETTADLTKTMSGAETDTTYVFQVAGVNVNGVEGERSDPVAFTLTQITHPELSIGTISDHTSVRDGRLVATWGSVTNADTYNVTLVDGDTAYKLVLTDVLTQGTDGTWTLNLDYRNVTYVNGQGHNATVDLKDKELLLQVQALQIVEGSIPNYSPVAVASISTKTEAPDAPTDLSAHAPTLTAVDSGADVTLSWTTPAYAGGNGAALTGYTLTVRYTDAEGALQEQVIENIGRGETSYVYHGAANMDYSFQLAAVNDAGKTSAPASASASTAAAQVTVPGAPELVKYLSDLTRVKVFWNAPTENGEAVMGYRVIVDGTPLDEVLDASTTSAIVTFTGTEPVHTVAVQAVAMDEAGNPVYGPMDQVRVNLNLNVIDDKTTLEEATVDTEPASKDPADLDKDMTGEPGQSTDPGPGPDDPDDPTKTVTITGHAVGTRVDSIKITLMSGGTIVDGKYTGGTAVSTETYEVSEIAADGSYSITIQLEDLSGSYDVVITAQNCTSSTIVGVTFSTDNTTVDVGESMLYLGDVTGDGWVNSTDVIAVRKGQQSGNAYYDLTGEGLVNSTDVMIVRKNINRNSEVRLYNAD